MSTFADCTLLCKITLRTSKNNIALNERMRCSYKCLYAINPLENLCRLKINSVKISQVGNINVFRFSKTLFNETY